MLLKASFAALALALTGGSPSFAAPTTSASTPSSTSTSSSDSYQTVAFDNRNFVNKGLVGFGRIGASDVDSYGETIGGIGSSIFVESLTPTPGGFSGTLRAQPDRGYNINGTVDYRARSQFFKFEYQPRRDNSTKENLNLQYIATSLYRTQPGNNYTTGLDALSSIGKNPDVPAAPSDNHVSIDQEGYAESNVPDISFFSDEYGPYIYAISRSSGQVLSAIRPPLALVPQDNHKDNFTSANNPQTGRAANQGFEGLTFDRKTNMLWALLQSATIQDSVDGSKSTNRYTRLLGYDAANPLSPQLKSEFVVPLPNAGKAGSKTYAASELHVVDQDTFLVLARDGNGQGDDDSLSKYKQADLISTKKASNIANSKYDDPANPVAPGGVLVPSVTPVTYQSFLSLIDSTQLAKFGLHNGGTIDQNLIASKLESLAIAPLPGTKDILLFVMSDNDFITSKGYSASQQPDGSYKLQMYSDPYAQEHGSQDTQVFIYQLTLPGYAQGPLPN